MRNFQKIIDFYVLNCPVALKDGEKVSQKAKTFAERGISKQKLITLIADIKTQIKKHNFNCLPDGTDIEKAIKDSRRETGEYMFFIPNNDIGKTKSIFYYIRNAFAHGDFTIEKGIYTLKSRKKKKMRAIFRLKEETLLYFMQLVDKYSN